MSIFFSIIIPTYNHEKYIKKCLESVKAQTFLNWEAIVLNDGSLDATSTIIDEVVKGDDRFLVINQENSGLQFLGQTYNKGLAKSNGKWICVLEGDDYWHPTKLLACYEEINRHSQYDIGLLWSLAYAVSDNDRLLSVVPPKFKRHQRLCSGYEFLDSYLLRSFIPSPTLVFSREKLASIGGFSHPLRMTVVDYPTILNICKHSYVLFIEEKLAFYRVHSNQATSNGGVSADAAANFAVSFYRELSVAQKRLLSVTQSDLEHQIVVRRGLNHFYRGRISLVGGDYKSASFFFNKMLGEKSFGIRARGYIGVVHTIFKFDLEWLAKLLGYRPLK